MSEYGQMCTCGMYVHVGVYVNMTVVVLVL